MNTLQQAVVASRKMECIGSLECIQINLAASRERERESERTKEEEKENYAATALIQ